MIERSKPTDDLDLATMVNFLTPRGFPTFDEFRKDPEKYRLGRYQLFESIENSTTIQRNLLAKQKVYWRYGKEAMSYGKLMRVMAEDGYKPEDCDCIPFRDVNGSGTGKDLILVRVFPKSEMKAMGAIVPNG